MTAEKTAEFDLLQKTELKIERITLKDANLTDIAATAAVVLGLNTDEIFVVDYRHDALTLDIVENGIDAHHLVGKKDRLLNSLGELPGVRITDETQITSNGMLGWIALDEGPAREALSTSRQMVDEIQGNIARRGIVFSSGAEVADGQIQDTNTPTIIRHLTSEGYRMTEGPTLKDEKIYIAAKLKEASDYGGYGLIITTGGVGAEDKDHTVEAVKMLDREAATPYICHFEIGTGRHVKDGVKIAVGRYNDSLIIALPGPNDEVKASMNIISEGLKQNLDKTALAERIAHRLRKIWKAKMPHHR